MEPVGSISMWDRLDATAPMGAEPQAGDVRFAEWVEAEAAVGRLSDAEALAALTEHRRILDAQPELFEQLSRSLT